MKKINIAELLKECPKGMELYSPLCGKCVFDCLNMGTIICKKQNNQEITFTSEGYYMLPVFDNCECMIFPSKDQRDWSKFHRPFKDGDVLYVDCTDKDDEQCDFIFILNEIYNGEIHSYCHYYIPDDDFQLRELGTEYLTDDKYPIRLATEGEKQKLFDAIKANGYKWNAETKTLEKLVPNKFDINTLKPFDKVLVRDASYMKWRNTFWGFYEKAAYPYYTTCGSYKHCIPYEDNQHLLGTTNDCDDFYKTWEK